jgi:very-short-patch-repair endonuclease
LHEFNGLSTVTPGWEHRWMREGPSNEAIEHLATAQHGLVTNQQLRAEGISSSQINWRVNNGRLIRLSPSVLRIAGAPRTPQCKLMAAVLDAGRGAVVSHESAAALWDLPGFELLPAMVTGRRCRPRRSSAQLGTVAQPLDLSPVHTTSVLDLPVTTPERTLFDLAARLGSDERLAQLVDTSLARRLVTVDRLGVTVDRLATRGRKGSAIMREISEERRSNPVPFESGLERRFFQLASQVGSLKFTCQVDVGEGETWLGRVDFLDRSHQLVVEVGSLLHHGSLTDRTRDEQRHKVLEAAGLTVASFTDVDVFSHPSDVVAQLNALALSLAHRRTA